MQKSCTVSVNNQKFSARRGDLLLDAGLASGIDIPHDCRSGHCGTCRVTVLKGLAWGGECDGGGAVKACQARVITDLEVLVEPVPDVVTTKGLVTGVRPLAPDVVEVRINLSKPVTYLPGQYYKFKFQGYPWRCFSPTAPMSGRREDQSIRLHVRRVPNGRVSSALGTQIRSGHRVKLEGPFGNAYLRANGGGRLVLVSSGTGFAPIWSIANAALEEDPMRAIVLVVGAKSHKSLYMGPAMRRLYEMPNLVIVPVAEEFEGEVRRGIRRGRPTDHMPPLHPGDIVYACGAPKMVDAVKSTTVAAGATFYADPFVPQANETEDGLLLRTVDLIRRLIPEPTRSAAALPHPKSFNTKVPLRLGGGDTALRSARQPVVDKGNIAAIPSRQRAAS